jgi:phage tail sheath protein FI
MPTSPTYPGVYVEEISSGVKTIQGVPTSITAFIGRTRKGPVNEPITVRSFNDFKRMSGGLWLRSTLGFAVRDFFINGGSEAIVVRLVKGARKALFVLPTSDETKNLVLEAINPGSWGNRLRVAIDYNTSDPGDSSLFNLTVAGPNRQLEVYWDVSVDKSNQRYLPRILRKESDRISVRRRKGKYDCPDIRPLETDTPIKTTQSTKGRDGSELSIEQFATGAGLRRRKHGLWALDRVDLFNLLCIPPYSFGQDIEPELIREAAEYCNRRKAILIIDPPGDWKSAADARNDLSSTNPFPGAVSSNTALYFPRIRQHNPLRRNNTEEFVPCGAVAGVIARTDEDRGVWKAPAGVGAVLKGAVGLSVELNNADNDYLNQSGINCLRTMPNVGPVVWGARTLAGSDQHASEWKYLSVRRTALYIEESLERGLEWVVFEPNDEPLWARIRSQVDNFLFNLWRQGAFQGTTQKQAFFVKCGFDTTTQQDINDGVVNIMVGFAPLKPAEFVIIKIQQKAGHN